MTTYKIWLNNATATTHCADEVIENKIDKTVVFNTAGKVTASFQSAKIKGWQIIEEDSENDDLAVGFLG